MPILLTAQPTLTPKLLSDKKAAYADYVEAKEEHRSLSLAKANVDRILGKEETKEQSEMDKEQLI